VRRERSNLGLMPELRQALLEYHRVEREADGLDDGLAGQAKLVRDLMMIIEFHVGRSGLMEILDNIGATGIAVPFVKRDQPVRVVS